MQESAKAWQVGLAIAFFVLLCAGLWRWQSGAGTAARLPQNIPAGANAATRTPEPDELVPLALKPQPPGATAQP